MTLILSGFFLGLAGSWLMIRYGEQLGIMDVPNVRSSHFKAVPKGGGVGILSALVVTGLVLKIPWFLWVPAGAISLASFWGADKHILPASRRLLIHFACALFFLVFFLASKQPGPEAYIAWLPVLVFIVGTANFFNFMDGIDGIAGINGFVAFLLMTFYARLSCLDPAGADLSLVMAFSCLGFLCFNIPKARVFLGDVGSILLGFIFACLVIFLSEDIMDFLVMAGFLFVFYMDELLTMVVRIKDRDSLIRPHRRHVYQVLANEAGIGHLKISLGYGLVHAIVGLSVIALQPEAWGALLGIYFIYGLIFGVFSLIIRKKFASHEN
ncbi:MAG: UDP-N-acetylmuramyl pentapeptide phosphotransferase [Desulfotignum sp.]